MTFVATKRFLRS